MSTIPSAESMNQELSKLYESQLPKIQEHIDKCIETEGWKVEDVSKLFFMKVDEAYIDAKKKILFVGRETFGWGTYNRDGGVDSLMTDYENVASYGKHYNSPFWWFREGFSEEFGIGKNEFMKSTLWTNLSKIDVDRKRPTGKQFDYLMFTFIGLLASEITIVKPDVVLIMTNDGYYRWHLDYYRWLQNKPFSNYDEPLELKRNSVLPGKIDRLIASGVLPHHTYQLSHPNVLRRTVGGYKINAELRIQALREQIKP